MAAKFADVGERYAVGALLAIAGCNEPASGGGETEDGSEAAEVTGSETGDGECPNVVQDGDFEMGPFGDVWSEGSELYDTVICDLSCLVGDTMAYDGAFWVWFGGLAMPESAFISQNVPIVAGTSTLSFFLKIETESTDMFAGSLTVLIDNQNLLMFDNTQEANYAEYTRVDLDVSAFADNSSHLLSFDANFTGTITTSFFLDAVELRSCAE